MGFTSHYLDYLDLDYLDLDYLDLDYLDLPVNRPRLLTGKLF